MARLPIAGLCLTMLLFFASVPASAQMTRNQLLKKYYQITKLHNEGHDAEAIAICEEITAMYPRLPDTYLRMAKIYDAAGEGSLALLMYCQYANLELDDKAVAEYLPRIKELEAQFKIPDQSLSKETNTTVPDTIDAMSLAMTAEIINKEPLDTIGNVPAILADKLSTDETGPHLKNTQSSDIKRLRNLPLRYVNIQESLVQFQKDDKRSSSFVPQLTKPFTSEFLKGKWISSLEDDSGREMFILNVFPRGSVVETILDGDSGLFHQNTDIISVSWKSIQSIWAPVSRSFDINELKDNTSSGNIGNGMFSFCFEFKNKKKADFIKISKDLVSAVLNVIPLGSFASKLSDGIFSYLQDSHTATTYQTVLRFDIKPVTDNVLSCVYSICEKQVNSGKSKEVLIERQTFNFYRCPDDYQYFVNPYSNAENLENKSLYHEILSQSEDNIDLNFPLAYMNYYGVGTKKNLPMAIGKMQALAEKANCNRARYWLASVCYNLSLDENHYPMRVARKQFRSICDRQIKNMSESGFYYVLGLQGDISSNEGNSAAEAVSYYENGARQGDAYCAYQLGCTYSKGLLVERNPNEAFSYFSKSAEMGYPDAYLELARCYLNGTGVKQDYGLYIEKLYEALEHDSMNAISELYNAYCFGAGVDYDFNKAQEMKKLFFKAKGNLWRGVLNQYCL